MFCLKFFQLLLFLFFVASIDAMKNVILIVLDDFRPAIRAGYGDTKAKTPHLNQLIKKSAIFNRIYAQVIYFES